MLTAGSDSTGVGSDGLGAVMQTVEVYLNPSGSAYASVRNFRRGESVSPSAFPDLHIPVDEIFA